MKSTRAVPHKVQTHKLMIPLKLFLDTVRCALADGVTMRTACVFSWSKIKKKMPVKSFGLSA